MSGRSLQDLKGLHRQLKANRQALEAAEKERQLAALRLQAEREVFTRAIGPVKPLKESARAPLPTPKRPPLAFQQQLDDLAALQESLSDDFDVSSLLDTDADLSFAQAGVGSDVLRKLRRGNWSLQGEIDLHGLRTEEAREALSEFLHHAIRLGWRCVRVVHGKGLGSPGRMPVLKQKVMRWLVQRAEVMAFVQAPAAQGGAGAVLVLLKGR